MSRNTLVLIGFILAKFFLQYLLWNPDYDLHRDEYLHLDQANHLAWGFQSVPPVTSWLAWLIKAQGNSVFWVRFYPALFGALTIFIVWKIITELKGTLFAHILGSTCVLFSFLLRLNVFFQPNSLDVLCWATLFFILIKYINTQKTNWLFIGSFIFAIGFLNKYNIAFLLIGLFPAIVLSRQRVLFKQWQLYISILLALLLISPNLVWQHNNHYPVLHHMKVLAATQLVHVNRLDFIKEQFIYFIGALPVIAASLYALWFYVPFKKYRLLLPAFFFTLAVFIFFRAKGYYVIGLYPAYIAFGSVYLGNVLSADRLKYARLAFLSLPVVFYILLFNIAFSGAGPDYILRNKDRYQKMGMLRWEDGKNHQLPQDVADMLGWKELAAKVERIYNTLPNKNQTLILCDNYGQAGAINYYAKNKNIKAVSFNADYSNWFRLNEKIVNFIRVKEFTASAEELKETGPYFGSAFAADSVMNPMAREYQTTIFVFSRPRININERLQAELDKQKNFTSE